MNKMMDAPGLRDVLVALAVLTALVALQGCGGGGDAGAGAPTAPATPAATPPSPPSVALATLSGVVSDAVSGVPVRGATVAVGGRAVVTDVSGVYVLDRLPLGSTIVQIIAPNHAATTTTVQSSGRRGDLALNIRLQPVSATLTFNPAAAQTLQDPNTAAAVVLPVAALVGPGNAAPVGSARVQLTPLGVNTMPGQFSTPAGQSIQTYGALQVKFTDANGTVLNLAPGKTATLRIPALGAPGAALPPSVPLFHFDTLLGKWVQEGSATLVTAPGGPYYQGTVTHFSTWNADEVMDVVFVRGRVIDAEGLVLPGAVVTCEGIDYAARTTAVADAQGNFAVPVRRDSRMVCQTTLAGGASVRTEIKTAALDVRLDDLDAQVPISDASSITLGSSTRTVTHKENNVYPLGGGLEIVVQVPFESVAAPLDWETINLAHALWEVSAVFERSDGGSVFGPFRDGANAFLPQRPDTVQGVMLDPYKGLLSFTGNIRLSRLDAKLNVTSVTFHMRMVTLKRNVLTGLFSRVTSNLLSYTVSLQRLPVQANGLSWLPMEGEYVIGTNPQGQSQEILVGRRLSQTDARAYCEAQGYRLPTLAEALAFYPDGPYGRPSGSNVGSVWTSTRNETDPVGQYQQVSSGGTSGLSSSGALALCTR